MPKQLVNLIGILVCVAVLALGIFLVAMPLATQALGVYAQAQQVAQTNVLYQAQVNALKKAKENRTETEAAVAALRAQIPATPQLDQVFDLIARASESTGATITSATAGTPAAFAPPAGSGVAGSSQPAPAPSPSATAGGIVGQAQQDRNQSNAQTAQTNAALGATTGSGSASPGASGTGASGQTRTQIPFAIVITATNMDQATAFLDALRTGPRLLANIKSTVAQNGPGIQASISAMTFVDGSATAGGTK